MQPLAPTKAPCCSGHKPEAVSMAGVSPVDAKTAAYICPMCEGVGSDKPGACPKCGMDLEKNPLAVSSTPECCGDGGAAELRELWWRLRWGSLMTLPVVLLSMGMDLPVIRDIPADASAWMQLVWATPVVFWCGWPLLVRFARSFATLKTNMFRLIGLGVGVAYAYSVVATLAPGLFPESLHTMHGQVPVYFEAAAVIVALVLLGQVLELRARAATGKAIKALLGLAPKHARRIAPDGSESDVDIGHIAVGDLLRVYLCLSSQRTRWHE